MRLPAVRTGDLEASLTDWLPRQRWFAGKGMSVDEVTILSDIPIVEGDPGMRHVIAGVRQGETVDQYQILLGVRESLPERLEYSGIGHYGHVWVYDAVHDHELAPVLLELLAAGATVGPLTFHTAEGVRIETGLASFVGTAEQSNTSIIFGSPPGTAYICKIFRRLSPGVNPDLEINQGLSELGSPHVPRLHGWISGDSDTTMAMMSEFLPTAADGWKIATASVRDLLNNPIDLQESVAESGGDFAAEAERLGAATAEVHRDLARAFGVGELPAEEIRDLAGDMRRLLATAVATVPEMAGHADRLGAAFDELAGWDSPIPVQPVHGDYHLGQVLRSETGWVVLDFEGEPARPAGERRRPSSPLKDVAGMLRSFEYAARFMLPPEGAPRLEALARDWADRNRDAFCRGYARAGGPDPAANQTLLRAFEYDKAVYEVLYEAQNRPDWLRIPLGSLPS